MKRCVINVCAYYFISNAIAFLLFGEKVNTHTNDILR